jgi:hypothetical protein
MSGTTTPNYGFSLPAIGGNQDSWGNLLNSNWTTADKAIHTLASGYLPITGGGVSGNLTAGGSIFASQTVYANNSNMAMGPSGANALLQLSPNCYFLLLASGVLSWNVPSAQLVFDASGNLNISGANATKPSGSASWIITSDDRTKRNVRPYSAGLADVCELAPIQYEYNGDGGTTDDGVTYVGLSAQATQPVMPELVKRLPASEHTLPDQLAIDHGPLLLAVVNALRELAERVTDLEAARLA